MKIKTDTRIIEGEHNGVPFKLEGGILQVNGYRYSKAEIRTLVNIATLLEVEGFKLVDTLPMVKRKGYISFIENSGLPGWGFDELRDDSEEGC